MKAKNSVQEKFNENIDRFKIQSFIKSEMKYSYKKGSWRIATIKVKHLEEMQTIYSWRIFRGLRQQELIINIDESSYSRTIKRNYSWLPIGYLSPILNTRWTGRVSIIFSLFNTGDWLWMSVGGTTKSKEYCLFLMILDSYTKMWVCKQRTPIKLMVDNASIHVSKESKRIWNYLNFEIHALPPYSPNLSPVEMIFGISKRKIAFVPSSTKINFSSSRGRMTIINSFNTLSKRVIVGLWRELVKQAKICIMKTINKNREKNLLFETQALSP